MIIRMKSAIAAASISKRGISTKTAMTRVYIPAASAGLKLKKNL